MSTLNYYKNAPAQPSPDWTCLIPEARYHEDALRGNVVTSSMLKEFRLCPAHYHALVTGRERKKETDAYRIGRAVHKRILEGEAAYRTAFSIGGPINEKTGRAFSAGSKAFGTWVEEFGLDRRRTLTRGEDADIARMLAAARSHPEVSRLLSEGWPERSAKTELHGLPCQIRLDWLRPDGIAVDVKTTANLARFEDDARRLGYLHQFAFYRDAARAAGAGDLEMTAVVLEKRPPFRVGVWTFPRQTLEPYSAQNQTALFSLRRCREEGKWPTGYERSRNFPPAGIPPLWLN